MYRSIEDFINDWEVESEGTIKIFTALTDELLTGTIHENVRSLGRLAWHLTQTITEMGKRAGLFADDELEDKAVPQHSIDILESYKQYCILLSRAVRLKWTDSSLADQVDMYGEQWEKGKVLRVLVNHQTHHRGQMTVIMRMLGLPVPGLYGPSKEEWAEFGMTAPE